MDVECSIGGHPASQKMLSVHNKMNQPDDDEQLLEEHDEMIEGDDDAYQLTELKNVNVSNKKSMILQSLNPHMEDLEELTGDEDLQDSLSQEIKMGINIVHTVYHYPALYDENDSSYHSKSYRSNAWRKIAQTLMWQGDIGSLQREWMQLKDRYEKVMSNKAVPEEADYQQLWDEMKWLDNYLGRHSQRVILGHPPSSQAQSHAGQRDSFYSDPSQTVAEDVMISGYRQPPPSSSGHRTVSSHPSSSNQSGQGEIRGSSGNGSGNGGYYLMKNSTNNQGHIRLVSENQHVPSSARVTVLPATRTSNGTAVVQLPPGSYARNQRVQIIHTPNSGQNGSYDHRVNVGDPGVTVTERGTVPRGVHVVKKEIIENGGEYYTTTSGSGEPKVYRIIPAHSDMHQSQGPSPTKRMRIIRPQNPNQQVNLISMTPSTSRHTIPMNALEDEVVIEDGVDQDVPPESPLLSESPGIGSMISGSNFQTGLGAGSPSSHPGYLQQAQYDADLQFQQLISSSLSRLDDNEKAIVKFHIQRILLENRYGSAITKSLIENDELDVGSNGVPHELVSQ